VANWSGIPPSGGPGRMSPPTFRTVFRGYDPDEVLKYLSRVADHVESLEADSRRLHAELDEARRQAALAPMEPVERVEREGGGDQYDVLSAHVADLVRTFDREVERLRADAEAEIERSLADARAEADRIRLDAQAKAEEARGMADRIVGDAQREVERSLSTLMSRRQAFLDELRSIRGRLLGATRDLDATIEGAAASGPEEVVVLEEARREPTNAPIFGSPERQPDRGA
jgi:DivIVA domain-containing protein